MLYIAVDFNDRLVGPNGEDRVFINTQRLGGIAEHLRPGLRVVLYTAHDVEIEATVGIDGYWYGVMDWTTRHLLPDDDGTEGPADWYWDDRVENNCVKA